MVLGPEVRLVGLWGYVMGLCEGVLSRFGGGV